MGCGACSGGCALVQSLGWNQGSRLLRCPWLPSDPLNVLEALLSHKLGPGAFAPQASLFTLKPVLLLAPQFMSPDRSAHWLEVPGKRTLTAAEPRSGPVL